MKNTTEPASRTRLVEILSEKPADSLLGRPIELRPAGDGKFCFSISTPQSVNTWPAERRWTGSISTGHVRPGWTRATRAIILLEHIATPDAIAILKDMATGHPDAEPTKAAKQALEILHESP